MPIDPSLKPYLYQWPRQDFATTSGWSPVKYEREYRQFDVVESPEKLAKDSRWPTFFSSAMCLVTTASGTRLALEKVVGPCIVNRFPYTLALSFCRQNLSERHYARQRFMEILESGEGVAVQFLPPGSELDAVMAAIESIPDERVEERLSSCGLPFQSALTNSAPVLKSAYMVYESKLVHPGTDFDGQPIFTSPWMDSGSHRIYFFEINAIQLRKDIASGLHQIQWRSLAEWTPTQEDTSTAEVGERPDMAGRYTKGFTPFYKFPSSGTVAFEHDEITGDRAVKFLAPLPEDQVEVDNDRARWPCFFPSSVGMITSWRQDGQPNLMPCGSTTVFSRLPLTIGIAVSYANINERYAPRASLDIIRQSGRFGCSVPYIADHILEALHYTGTVSIRDDPDKVKNSGLHVENTEFAPVISALPVHMDCRVVHEQPMGTHTLFLGEVQRVLVRADLTPENPLKWHPWASLSDREDS